MAYYYRPLSSTLKCDHLPTSSHSPETKILSETGSSFPRFPRDGPRIVQDHQDQEGDSLRLALGKMADDVLGLRQLVTALEMENSRLRRHVAARQDSGSPRLHDSNGDTSTEPEETDRSVTLEQKLAGGTSGARHLKKLSAKVLQLQNELIRKNDREKDLLMLRQAQQQKQQRKQQQQWKQQQPAAGCPE
ncbi:coiled-coil domain-containing protein 33-like [Tachyglossus aculeatus]|uniref:coiled-coil domain-containing protein 33-like n=1 Tax=Tachyglossus aculeatus TaxID=9261 RepID=UPI0018F53A8A|nr:coiled-coil domain-containing protein 33-like [Tachyglossus aculeatus]